MSAIRGLVISATHRTCPRHLWSTSRGLVPIPSIANGASRVIRKAALPCGPKSGDSIAKRRMRTAARADAVFRVLWASSRNFYVKPRWTLS